jgi:hypothetical protein
MALKIKGGSFTFEKEVEAQDASFLEYFKWLSQKNDKDILWPYSVSFGDETPPLKKQLYIYSSTQYWYGVILSGKTKQFQHILKRVEGRVTIKAIELNGEPPLELNFFCIRKDSGKGIYSHYVGSYPFSNFIKDLWGSYRTFVTLKRENAIALKEQSKAKISFAYSMKGKCLYGPLYSPKEFEKLIDKLQYVEEIRLTTYEVESEEDEPVSGIFKSKREIYNFNNEGAVTVEVKKWLFEQRKRAIKILKGNKTKFTGAISGFDYNDDPITIDFDKTMQNFINYDYDKLGSIEIDELFNHEIIKLMKAKLKNDSIFKVTQ